jgi:hypothetical protein
MRAFVEWVLTRRYRLIVLAIALAPIVPGLTTALLALETTHRGSVQGTSSAFMAIGGVLALALISGPNVMLMVAIGAVSLSAGVGIGALLRETNSFALVFQSILLVCVAVIALVSFAGPDSSTLFGTFVTEFGELWRERGATEAEIAALEPLKGMMLGLLAALVFAQLVVAGALSQWWSGLVLPVRSFGAQFRQLRLGRVLGVPATLLVGLSLVLDIPLVQNLSPLALLGFWFQGLAVLHAWAYARKWKTGLLVPVYVLLFTPFTGIVILALGSVGLVDNWFDLRAPLRPR